VDAKLESKSKEIEEILDGKIAELKKESASLKNELQLFQAKKIQHDEFMEKLNSELSQLDKTKNTLISEMNSELIKAKSANQEFLDGAQEKVAKLDERVNKTLEVGLDVIDGIKADAETNLKSLVGDKIKAMSTNSKDQTGELEDTKRAFEIQIREHMHKLTTLEKDLKVKIEKLDRLHEKLESDFDPKTIKQQMGDLEMFKSQFVKVIEINVKKFNTSLQKINEQSKWLESQINKRMKLIDAKMKELDEFEENFAKEMGQVVEKGFKKNSAKKKK
jgi:chromosome segregation ATPase